jgi:hypothetical protein
VEGLLVAVVVLAALVAGWALWTGARADDPDLDVGSDADLRPGFALGGDAAPCLTPSVRPDRPLWPAGEGETVFHYQLRAADGTLQRAVALDDLGRLVVVTRDGPLSADELRSTLLAPEGADRLLALVTTAVAEPVPAAPAGGPVATVVLADRSSTTIPLAGPPTPAAPGGPVGPEGLPAVLADLAWLTGDGDLVVEPDGPWVPPVLAVTPTPTDSAAPPVTWPGPTRIEPDRVVPLLVRGEVQATPVLALFGSDEAPVVEAEGRRLALTLAVDLPGEPPIEPPPDPGCLEPPG